MSAGRRCKIARIVRSRILARSRLRRFSLTATSLLLVAPVFVSPVLKAQSEATAEDARVQRFYGEAKAAEARGDLAAAAVSYESLLQIAPRRAPASESVGSLQHRR